ncbi:L,D-transpeptidase [Rhodobacter capsulatus]|uniref:L,D-transpeptidase n=1 Tax=Rhodobacter capsulatus TaxID=1061 RepID=A0A4U1JQ51_RHOCA|nr:L,D-transpeptidase [Rhodobacter capsulatus]TKD18204.1 L,D-transpeptidase [Rhodobacter capsulatus]
MSDARKMLDRRSFLGTAAFAGAALAAPAVLAQALPDTGAEQHEESANTNMRRNISSFRELDWKPYFSNTKNGIILVDTISRALHFWSEDESVYKLYPTSVPVSEELTRRGRTEIIRKVKNPTWSPTPSMKQRNPEWPDFVEAGPDNPLGTRAMYLSWQYYRIHGTHDTRKIGRKSSNGCIGLFNQHVEELFELAQVGTQVVLI